MVIRVKAFIFLKGSSMDVDTAAEILAGSILTGMAFIVFVITVDTIPIFCYNNYIVKQHSDTLCRHTKKRQFGMISVQITHTFWTATKWLPILNKVLHNRFISKSQL